MRLVGRTGATASWKALQTFGSPSKDTERMRRDPHWQGRMIWLFDDEPRPRRGYDQ